MEIAAFQSLYPEEVRIHIGEQFGWIGSELQYYEVQSGTWESLANFGFVKMFEEKLLTFDILDGLVRSSILAKKEFVIIVNKNLIGFLRGQKIKETNEDEINIEIDWNTKNEEEKESEFLDFFSPEKELKNLIFLKGE